MQQNRHVVKATMLIPRPDLWGQGQDCWGQSYMN